MKPLKLVRSVSIDEEDFKFLELTYGGLSNAVREFTKKARGLKQNDGRENIRELETLTKETLRDVKNFAYSQKPFLYNEILFSKYPRLELEWQLHCLRCARMLGVL